MLHTVVIQFGDQKVSYVYSENSLLMQIIDSMQAHSMVDKFTHKGHLMFTWCCISGRTDHSSVDTRWVDACLLYASSISGALRNDYCTQNCEAVYITLDSYYDLDTW